MSNDNSLEKIIAALGEEELELTGEEITEILWLTLQRQEFETTEFPSTVENVSSDSPLSEETDDFAETITSNLPLSEVNDDFEENFSSDTTFSEGIDNSPDLTDLPSSPRKSVEPVTTPLYANEPTFDDEEVKFQESFLPLRVPDAPSVREPLNLVKALKPLMQRVASGRETVLDEVATAEAVEANEGILVPVFQQELEPWLDLALVIDQSDSMVIWRQTVEDLQRLFKHYGIFRDVRVWDLVTSSQGKIALQPHKSQSQRLADPLELVEPNGRRLILIVSDCVAPMWSTGLINPTLQTWTKHQPVAIMQMLPDWLWLRSGLGLGAKVSFVNSLAGAPNQRIKVNDVLLWQDIDLETGVKIPVINLDSESPGPWSEMVAGNAQVEALGFVLSDQPYTPPSKGTTTPSNAVDPEQRIQRFRRTASPLARKLAGLLGAAPVINLPIVRSVQATLLPQSNQINVAEVFLGGLLKPITEVESGTDPDTVRYEFMTEEIRELLLKDSPVRDSTQVIDAVSRYVADGLGMSMQEFVALLKRPGQGVEEEVREFARLTAKVLQQLGGEYAKFAQELENRHGITQQTGSQKAGVIQFEEVEGDGVGIELEPFEAEVATIVFKEEEEKEEETREEFSSWEFETVFVDGWGEIVRTQQCRADYFEEFLGEGVPPLVMVAIPEGEFMMGSSSDEKGRYDDEGPQHLVKVQPFSMGQTPITQAQWHFVAGMDKIRRELNPNPSNFKGDNLPVEQVSWYDAMEFCARLSLHTGKDYRLPSEAEWEYACRASPFSKEEQKQWPFHFGETITTDLANYDGSVYKNEPEGKGQGRTSSVKRFPANAFGLYDLHGNAREWCADPWHRSYEDAPQDSRVWDENNNDNRYNKIPEYLKDLLMDERTHVLRSGSWYFIPRGCRSAYRFSSNANDCNDNFGFRLACSFSRNLP